MNLVYFLIRKYYPSYIGNEDVIQEGMLGLIKAVDTWDKEKSELSTYASRCITNQIKLYFRIQSKQAPCRSLEEVIYNDGSSEGIRGEDTLPGEVDVDFGSIVFNRFLDTLTEEERLFLEMCSYMNQEDIGKALNIKQPTVSRRRTALKKKWRKFNGDD